MSGPDYCGSCACGTPPEVSQLRRKLETVGRAHTDALLMLAYLLAPNQPMFAYARIKERAQELVERHKAIQPGATS